jgi:hypothetical protein
MESKMNSLLSQVSYPVFLYMTFVFFLIASVFAFLVGIALAVRSKMALRFFAVMNRWISVRKVMRPLSTPHYIEPALLKRRTVLGSSISLGALATIALLAQADLASALSLLNGSLPAPEIRGIADNLKVFLLVGNAICVALGVLVLFYPHALSTLENYTDRWISIRQSTQSLDQMHMDVDAFVLKHPTSAGVTLCIVSFSAGMLILNQLQALVK